MPGLEIPDDTPEELPTPPQPSEQRRRLTIAAGVLVAVLIVLAIANRATSGSTGTADPAVTVTASPSPDAAVRTPTTPPTSTGATTPIGATTPNTTGSDTTGSVTTSTLDPSTTLGRPLQQLPVLEQLSSGVLAAAHAQCPRLAESCVTTGEAPSEVVAALRSAFPRARDFLAVSDIVYTTTSGPRLAFRRVSATSGPLQIAVEVHSPQPGDTGRVAYFRTAGRGTSRAQAPLEGHTVELQVTGPGHQRPEITTLQTVVVDQRLLATG